MVVSVLVDRGTEVGGSSLSLSDDLLISELVVLLLENPLLLGGELGALLSSNLGDDVGLVLGSERLGSGNRLDSVLVVVDMLLPRDGNEKTKEELGREEARARWDK